MEQQKITRHIDALYPLVANNETEELEQAWKAIFLAVVEKTLQPQLDSLLHYGLPHRANIDILKRVALSDGLSVMRSDAEIERLRYLLKAWRVKNPKRGFHFLHTYLQMLYPNAHQISQLWQEKSKAYPTALSTKAQADKKRTAHFLTSRVAIDISDISETGEQLLQFIPTIRALLPARFVLQLSVSKTVGAEPNRLVLASGFTAWAHVEMSGTCVLPS